MLSNRVLAAAAVLTGITGLAHAVKPIACPPTIDREGKSHPLQRASVFDGRPEELADLIPENGRWDLEPYQSSGRDLYLVCRYRATAAVNTMIIPRGQRQCLETVAHGVNVSCR